MKKPLALPLSLFQNSYIPYLVILFLVSGLSFFAGTLYTKVLYFENGAPSSGTTVNVAAGSSLSSALKGFAKQLKLDEKKFTACFDSGKYAKQVTTNASEGSSLGVQGTPGFFVNGKFVGGAFPVEAFKDIIDKELAGTGSENAADYLPMLQEAFNSPNKSFDPVPKQLTLGDAPIRGDKNAKVTIVEYSDFQCPYCSRALPTVDQILSEYKGKVKLAYKHLPLTQIHPNAQKAAEASECAKEQNKFWEYHDVLFKNQQSWSNLPQA